MAYSQTARAAIPEAILATGITLLSALSFYAGLILDTVTRGRREMKMLAYLGMPAPVDSRRA